MAAKEKSLKDQILDPELYDKVENKINNGYKVPIIDRPKKILPFPEDVTTLSSEEVGRFLAMYDAEIAYIRSVLARVEVQVDHGRTIINTYRKKLYLEHRSTCSGVDAQAWVDIDKDVVAAERSLQELVTERSMLQARLDSFTKYSASISREISRRKSDFFGAGEKGEPEVPGAQGAQERRIGEIRGKDFTPKRKNK